MFDPFEIDTINDISSSFIYTEGGVCIYLIYPQPKLCKKLKHAVAPKVRMWQSDMGEP